MWELFTKNLNKFSKSNKNKIIFKSKKIKNNTKELPKLKLGEMSVLSKKNIRDFNKGNVFIEKKLDLHGFNLV